MQRYKTLFFMGPTPQKQRTNGFQVGFVHLSSFVTRWTDAIYDLQEAKFRAPSVMWIQNDKMMLLQLRSREKRFHGLIGQNHTTDTQWREMSLSCKDLFGRFALLNPTGFLTLGLKDTGNPMKSPRKTQKSVQYLGLLVMNNDLKPSRMSQVLLILQK